MSWLYNEFKNRYKLNNQGWTNTPPESWYGKVCWFTDKLPVRPTTTFIPKRLGVLWKDEYPHTIYPCTYARICCGYMTREHFKYCKLFDDKNSQNSLMF